MQVVSFLICDYEKKIINVLIKKNLIYSSHLIQSNERLIFKI